MKVDVPAFPCAFDTKEIVDVSGDHVEAREEHDRDEECFAGSLVEEACSECDEEKSQAGPDEEYDSRDCQVGDLADDRRDHPEDEVVSECYFTFTEVLCDYRILLSLEVVDDRPFVADQVV